MTKPDIIPGMKTFYTGKGDDGTTGLLGDERVSKDHPRPRAFGTVDEASAALGLAKSLSESELLKERLETVQRDLYHMMAELAATAENAARFRVIDALRVEWLEKQISDLTEEVEIPKEFVLPGGNPAGAALDLARTVVRRAERVVVELNSVIALGNPFLVQYLNRLSSLCFLLALNENQTDGTGGPTLARKGKK
jgi:cob(I)alamin adenosyltransferase